MSLIIKPNIHFANHILSAIDLLMMEYDNSLEIIVSYGIVASKPAIYFRDSESRHHVWIILPNNNRRSTDKYRTILREKEDLPPNFQPNSADRSCWIDWPPTAKHVYDFPISDVFNAAKQIFDYLHYGTYPETLSIAEPNNFLKER